MHVATLYLFPVKQGPRVWDAGSNLSQGMIRSSSFTTRCITVTRWEWLAARGQVPVRKLGWDVDELLHNAKLRRMAALEVIYKRLE